MLDVLVANLPIVISLLTGIVLLVVEAFMPGFGIAGFSGIGFEIAAVVIAFMQHGAGTALCVLLIGLAMAAVAISMSLRSIARGKLSESPLILRDTEDDESGYRSSEDTGVFLGREGVATTILRPTGMAEFDGVKLNVMTDGEFVQPGARVKIIRAEGSRIVVQMIS